MEEEAIYTEICQDMGADTYVSLDMQTLAQITCFDLVLF